MEINLRFMGINFQENKLSGIHGNKFEKMEINFKNRDLILKIAIIFHIF
jgi:hypothetical protein